MPLRLSGRHLRALGETSPEPFIGRISTRRDLPHAARASEILLLEEMVEAAPEGFRAVLVRRGDVNCQAPRDVYRLGPEFAYLKHGDIVRIEPHRQALVALYRRNSDFNSLLVTERCDNYCVMCSQPPKAHDDSWLVDELIAAIPMMAPDTREIGLTGGEPSLLGDRLVALVERLHRCLPQTSVHVLSNGRGFASGELARALAAVRHPDLMVGIPLYSALSEEHDYIVQARGAYDETLQGILNLKQRQVRVELRFVIQRDTYRGLPAFARFVARNLLFVDHVALMGLELTGFARTNLDALWIDPVDYQQELAEAVATLSRAQLRVSIYNHQLCVLDPSLHGLARASISDWKNEYFEECQRCSKRETCGGFFASSVLRRSRAIRAL